MDNTTAQRKRTGRSIAKVTVSTEQHQQKTETSSTEEDLEAAAASQLTDIDGINTSISPSLDTSGATAAAGAECRRSSRKKIIKFDVRDLLNKNRKPHKIQIEARIDSNAPAPLLADSSRQAPGSAASGGSANIASTSTASSDLTNKQKTFIEKSAIFRRFSISAEQQSKIPTPLRPPLPPVAKLTPNKISLLSNTSSADVSKVHALAETAKIAQARRLSRTQEIFNASMMKSKQNSSLIVAQMESSSSSSSSTIAMQRRAALSVTDNAVTKRRGAATKSTSGVGFISKQPDRVLCVSSEKSSSPVAEQKLQKRRGRPPKNKSTEVPTPCASSANIKSIKKLTATVEASKASSDQLKLTPEKAKNWQEYKACLKVCDERPKLLASSRSQTADEILEISSSSESEADSIQSPGSDESYTLNEPSTSKRHSKQRNFAAVSFLQEITSKLSDIATAPEFIVASVEEIHSEPLTACSSMTNLHDSQLLMTAESSNKTDVGDAAETMSDETVIKQATAPCAKENTPSRTSSISGSESESNSDRSLSKSYKHGDKLRVSLKRLSAQELSPGKENSRTSSPPSHSSSSSPTNSSNESSSIKEDSSDPSRERKQHIRKRSKRLQMLELEKAQMTDGSSSLEEKETIKNKKRHMKTFNMEKSTVTMEDETNNSDVAKEHFKNAKSLDLQEVDRNEPQKAIVTDAEMQNKTEPKKDIVSDLEMEDKTVTDVQENVQTINKEGEEENIRKEKETSEKVKITDIDPLKINEVIKNQTEVEKSNEIEFTEKEIEIENKKEQINKNIEIKTIESTEVKIKQIEDKNNKQNEKPLSTSKTEKLKKEDLNEGKKKDFAEKKRKDVEEKNRKNFEKEKIKDLEEKEMKTLEEKKSKDFDEKKGKDVEEKNEKYVEEQNRNDDEEKKRKDFEEEKIKNLEEKEMKNLKEKKSKDVDEIKDSNVEELNMKATVTGESNIKKKQTTQKSEDKKMENIREIKELSKDNIAFLNTTNEEQMNRIDENDKLNREIENEIAKEIKDLLNKDIDKDSIKETDVELDPYDFKQLNKKQIDELKTIAMEELSTIAEQELNQKDMEKTKNKKLLKNEEQKRQSGYNQKIDKKASDGEEIYKNENFKDKLRTPTPPGKKSKDNKDCVILAEEICKNENLKKKLRISTPPRKKSTDNIITSEPDKIVPETYKSDIMLPFSSPHSTKDIQSTPIPSEKKFTDNITSTVSKNVPFPDKSDFSSSAKKVDIVEINACGRKLPQKLLTESAAEKPSISEPPLRSVEIHSKSMPKLKEPIKLPPKKQLREHKININLDDTKNTPTDTLATPNISNLVSQISEQVNVETKTLLDILKTVQSNESAAAVASASVNKTANSEKIKSGDSPPRSPAAGSKKPTMTVRRYERRSRRVGEDETLHKTLEETFAEIAAQSSKAILDMFSNREEVEGTQKETQELNQEETKKITKEETQNETKEEKKELTQLEAQEKTREENLEETDEKTRKENKETTEETNLVNKYDEKVINVANVITEELKNPKEQKQDIKTEKNHQNLVAAIELGSSEESTSLTLSKPKDSKTDLNIAVSIDIMKKTVVEIMNSEASSKTFTKESPKTKIVDKLPQAPDILEQQIEGEESKQIEDKTMPEKETKPEEKTKSLEKEEPEEAIKPEEQTNSEEKMKPKEQTKCEEKIKQGEKTKPKEQIKPEEKTKPKDQTKLEERTKPKEKTKPEEKIKPEELMKLEEKSKLENASQIEVKTTTQTKRGRKPKAKEKESMISPEFNRTVRSRKSTVAEKSSKPLKILKKTNENSDISETSSNSEDSILDSEKVKNICLLTNTELTEINKMVLETTKDPSATKESENLAENKNAKQVQELTQKPESLEVFVKTSNELVSNEKAEKKMPVEASRKEVNQSPELIEQGKDSENKAKNLITEDVFQAAKKSEKEAEYCTPKVDKDSMLSQEHTKDLEKSATTKIEEKIVNKKCKVDNKDLEKTNEKHMPTEFLKISSNSSSDDLVPKSMVISDEVLTKPPPKKRFLKKQQQQIGESKDVAALAQDKIVLPDTIPETNPKKGRKSSTKLNTSLAKEELVSIVGSERANMPTSTKSAPKTKQKRTVTPTEYLAAPYQPSSKKKSKKHAEDHTDSLLPIASSPKTPEKKTSKKLDRKKFLESENDADGKTVAIDDKTAKKKRQKKLKEAFEAALTEVGSTIKDTSTTLTDITTTAVLTTIMPSVTTTTLIVTTPPKGETTPTKTAISSPTPPPSSPLPTTDLPSLDKLAKVKSTVDTKPTQPNFESTTSLGRQTPQSPLYNMPLTPTNFDLKTTIETTNTEPAVVQPEEDPDDPLKDIEKFIEDGVNLLKRGYKIEDDEDDSVDGVVLNAAKKLVKEDLLSTPLKDRDLTHHTDLSALTSFAETPTDTPLATPSVTPPPKSPTGPETPPSLSDDSFTTSGGVRRSHRIKQNSKTPKALVGRGLVRDKERVSLKDDVETKTHYTIDDHRMDLAEVEAKNAKFLKDMEERLSNFRVIKENEYKCERIVSKEAKKMICDCFLTADEEERGELACGEDCLNRLLMIECGPECNVKERCTNKRFQKFLCSPCRVFRTEKKGFGIMADIEILPGEFIMEYVGEVINGDEFERRRVVYSLDKNRHYYFMALRSDAIIDATSKGNISRFINHSCDPNAETQKWTVNGELRIGFFSRKSIMPGEEITFDYQYQRYGREAQRCYCESSNCRGWIGEEPNSDEGEQVDDESDGDEEEENLAESLLAEDDDDEDDSDETDADADAEEAQKKLEKAAAEAKLTPIMEEDDKKQMLDAAVASSEKRKKSDADADGVLETSKEEDSKSKFKKLLSKMAEKVAKKKNKKERRRKQRSQRDEAGTAIKTMKPRFLEDPDIEDEVHFLSRCGLKNQSDTLRLSRLMVRAKLVQTRLNLLKILRSGELPCRRLFLDYHGLRLLHGWISEDGGDLNTRLALLETLETLPIANKTMLTDSKVYQAVRNWCGNLASTGDLARSNSLSPSDESSKESTNSQVGQPQEIPSELKKLASKLTATWDSLPEIFRIPKRERIEQMKEHEREADRQYAAVAATRDEEDTRRSYSTSDRYQRDRFGRGGPPGGGSNSSHRFSWSRGGGNGKESRNISVLGTISSGDPRRRGCGMDTTTHGSTDSTKHLSKEQRREMFAAKVARDEAEKRLAEERREFETKCRFFGLDPKKTRPQNLPFCVNPSTGQWYSADRQPIPTPPSYAHVQVPVKPKSTNPADYQLPPTTANLSHKWKFAITPQGKIYYYHVQFRIPQWEPPTHEQMYGSSAMQAGGATTNSDSGSDGVTNESTDDDDEIIKGMEPTRLQAYVDQKIEMRRQQRYNRLVDERSISPRREEDRIYNQMEVRKYKENKEKIRKRKEEIRRRRVEAVQNSTLNMCTLGRLDDILTNTGETIKSSKLFENESVLPIQDYLLSSDEEEAIKAECNNSPLIDKIVQGDKIVDELDALTSKRPLKRQLPTHRDLCSSSSGFSGSSSSSSPATYSSSVEKHEQHKKRKLEKRESSKSGKKSKDQDSKYRKLKEKFRCEIAGIIVHHLKPYRKEACIIGRIQSNDDFNHLARKLTHFVMIKELKYCESVGQTLVVTESVKNKSREFIKKYMAKYGDVYIKPDNDPDFKDIPFTLKI